MVSATWILFKMADWFKSHVNSKIGEMVIDLRKPHKVEVDRLKLYTAKLMDLGRLGGGHACTYNNLYKYDHMLGLMTLGTIVKVKCERSIALDNLAFQSFCLFNFLPRK